MQTIVKENLSNFGNAKALIEGTMGNICMDKSYLLMNAHNQLNTTLKLNKLMEHLNAMVSMNDIKDNPAKVMKIVEGYLNTSEKPEDQVHYKILDYLDDFFSEKKKNPDTRYESLFNKYLK